MVCCLVVGLVIKTTLIDGILEAPFAEGFVGFCQKIFQVDYYTAVTIYQRIFLSSKSYLLFAGFLCFFIISVNWALKYLDKCFKQIVDGIDLLVSTDNSTKVDYMPELEFIEVKLTQVKNHVDQRNNAAMEAEQRKNELVMYLAHDIKTPLTSVIGYLSLMEEASEMPSEQKARYVNITLEKAYRLEELINEFFEITRFNMQTITLGKERINLTYMLRQMADEFYPILVPQHKKAVVNSDEDIIITGDANKLARVFNNILKNAISYSYEESTITIDLKQEKDGVVICFTNVGVTVPPEKLNMLFEKFFRLDSARATNTGGAGLGLAIAKEIVLAHGGQIYADSQNEETVFTVKLPVDYKEPTKNI